MDAYHVLGVRGCIPARLDFSVGDGRMGNAVKKQHYDPNSERNLARSIGKMERKLHELQLRKQITVIVHKIKALDEIRRVYPPHERDPRPLEPPYDELPETP
jgi:hypothetical protein